MPISSSAMMSTPLFVSAGGGRHLEPETADWTSWDGAGRVVDGKTAARYDSALADKAGSIGEWLGHFLSNL
jgi:hypothetical protein